MPPPSPGPEQAAADPRLRQAEAALQSGSFAAAAAACREILSARPKDSAALQLLGVALLNQGELEGARAALLEYAELNPESVEGLALLATVDLQRSEWEGAESWCRRAVVLAPEFVPAYLNLGLALHGQARFEEAVAPLRDAVRLRPDYADAHLQLGVTLLAIRDSGKALEAFDRTIALSPRSFEGHYNRGLALLELDRLTDAEVSFARSADLNPQDEKTILALARTMHRLKRFLPAIEVLRQALMHNQKSPGLRALLGDLLLDQGWSREARSEIQKALELDPDNPNHRLALAKVLTDLNRFAEARSARQKALELAPQSNVVITALAFEHLSAGRNIEAATLLEGLKEASPDDIAAHVNLAMVRKFVPGDERLGPLLNFIKDEEKYSREDRTLLHFALGRAFDELGDFDRAFDHFTQANAIQEYKIPGLEEGLVTIDRKLREKFSRHFVQFRHGYGSPSSLPIFILGMPRSGTTLVEQFLSMHPDVGAAGEVKDFAVAMREAAHRYRLNANPPDLVAALPREAWAFLGNEYVARLSERRPGAHRVTDKLPFNFEYAGIIHLALPNAKIIHCIRSPLDCCFSIFSNYFADTQEHARDLERLARTYRRYHTLMQHWRAVLPEGAFLDVSYEDLVGDFESGARRVIEYCGLAWDPACLDYQRSERPVETLSINQVRQPIYQSSISRWRNYERHLGPLIEGLGDLARQ